MGTGAPGHYGPLACRPVAVANDGERGNATNQRHSLEDGRVLARQQNRSPAGAAFVIQVSYNVKQKIF